MLMRLESFQFLFVNLDYLLGDLAGGLTLGGYFPTRWYQQDMATMALSDGSPAALTTCGLLLFTVLIDSDILGALASIHMKHYIGKHGDDWERRLG
jgi:hypothetical protein